MSEHRLKTRRLGKEERRPSGKWYVANIHGHTVESGYEQRDGSDRRIVNCLRCQVRAQEDYPHE